MSKIFGYGEDVLTLLAELAFGNRCFSITSIFQIFNISKAIFKPCQKVKNRGSEGNKLPAKLMLPELSLNYFFSLPRWSPDF